MNLINTQTGDRIVCIINSKFGLDRTIKSGLVKVTGKIKRERNNLYICQDNVCSGSMGDSLIDKQGFKEAWFIGSGSEDDLESWGVVILESPDYDQNYERIS